MNDSIVRTDEEIKLHIDELNKFENKPNKVVKSVLQRALWDDSFDPKDDLDILMETKDLPTSYERDAHLWLIGKFYKAPIYIPLDEPQISAHQVISDFGGTKYTAFKLS